MRENASTPSLASSQSSAFLQGEGDRYFARNLAKYSATTSHLTLPALELAVDVIEAATRGNPRTTVVPPAALEVGCANGLLLNRLCSRLQCEGYGIDPSAEAISDGTQRFPSLKLGVGTGESLPYVDGRFDYVLLGFFLYLLQETHYLMALAEANRVLRPGGFLILVDFDHPNTSKRPYAHRADVASYRHRALDVLTATRIYSLVAKWPVGTFAFDPLERVSLSLLYREPDAYPLITEG
jgi:ubiquinone/menaquinone biosynthesis C-methylase UbiE